MVLPRRTKVRDTLRPPYDRLFSVCNRFWEARANTLFLPGFSFGDQHINDEFIVPKIQSGEINLTNFCQSEPLSLNVIRDRPNLKSVCASERSMAAKSGWLVQISGNSASLLRSLGVSMKKYQIGKVVEVKGDQIMVALSDFDADNVSGVPEAMAVDIPTGDGPVSVLVGQPGSFVELALPSGVLLCLVTEARMGKRA
jgi:hypothetical protein